MVNCVQKPSLPIQGVLILLLAAVGISLAIDCFLEDTDGKRENYTDLMQQKHHCMLVGSSHCFTLRCGGRRSRHCLILPSNRPNETCKNVRQICRERYGDPDPYCRICDEDYCNNERVLLDDEMVSPAVGTTTMKPTKIVTTMMSPNKEAKTVSPTTGMTMMSHHRRRKPQWSADDWEEDIDVTNNGDNTVVHDAQG